MSEHDDTRRAWQYVGRRRDDGARVFVSIILEDHDGGTTVDHTPAGAYQRLSIIGATVDKGRRDIATGGQIESALLPIGIVDPAPGWSHYDISNLYAIWHGWHLNDLRAACAHMDLPSRVSYDDAAGVTCPETGYRYGHAWLVETLPAGIVADVERLRSLPAGDVPAYVST